MAARRLVAALQRHAAAAGCTPLIEHCGELPWASVTFAGARHRLAVAVGAAADEAPLAAWLASLPEAELAVPGWLVADCALVPGAAPAVSIEVLLLDT